MSQRARWRKGPDIVGALPPCWGPLANPQGPARSRDPGDRRSPARRFASRSNTGTSPVAGREERDQAESATLRVRCHQGRASGVMDVPRGTAVVRGVTYGGAGGCDGAVMWLRMFHVEPRRERRWPPVASLAPGHRSRHPLHGADGQPTITVPGVPRGTPRSAPQFLITGAVLGVPTSPAWRSPTISRDRWPRGERWRCRKTGGVMVLASLAPCRCVPGVPGADTIPRVPGGSRAEQDLDA